MLPVEQRRQIILKCLTFIIIQYIICGWNGAPDNDFFAHGCTRSVSKMNGQVYDVIVAGGGPAGIAAAVASARQGARTLLLERYGIVGGMMTSGYVNPVVGLVEPGSMRDEVMELLGAQEMTTRNGKEMSVDTEQAKYLLLKFLIDAGVTVMLQTPVVAVETEENTVTGLTVSTPEGLKTVSGKVIVDATGDGMVCALAGAEWEMGRESDGKCQPTTLEFTVDGVDETHGITCWGGTDPVKMPDGQKYSDFCRQKNTEGELPKNVSIVRLHRTATPGERSVNATQANGYNILTPEGILGAEYELRCQINTVVSFLRKYVPGFENCRLKATGSTLGVRETRRITGDYIVNDEDVETGTRKEDVVVHKAWFLIDIHNPAGGGQAEGHSQPAVPYDIPYRALLPRGLNGILTCGRCISGTHRAHASYRVMGVCLATGQAAGIAAALAARNNVRPRELDVRTVQNALTEAGARLWD